MICRLFAALIFAAFSFAANAGTNCLTDNFCVNDSKHPVPGITGTAKLPVIMLPGTPDAAKYLRGDGTWQTVGGSSPVLISSTPNTDSNIASLTPVTIFTNTVTASAGQTIVIEVFITTFNNSGANATYTATFNYGSYSQAIPESIQTASATSRAARRYVFTISISASNLAYIDIDEFASGERAANTVGNSVGGVVSKQVWSTTASDLTGLQTISLTITSSTNTVTQTATLHNYRVSGY